MAQFLICEEDGFNAATHFNFDEDSHKHLVCAEHLECLQKMGAICMPVAYYDRVESYDQYRLLKRSEERMIQDRKRGLKQWEDDLEYQYSKAQDEVKHLSSLHPGFIPTAPVLDSLLQRKQKLSAQLTHLSQSLSPDSFNDPDTQLLQASYAGELPFFLLVWNVSLGKAPAPVMLSYMDNFEKHRDILQEQITEITRNIDELLQNRSFKNLFHCMHLLALATSLLPDQHDCHLNYYQIITHSLFEKYNQVLGILNEYSQQIAFSALISFFICGDWRPIKALVVLGRIQDNLASEDKQYRAETLLHLYAVLKALDDLKVPEIAKMRLEVSSRIGVCMRLGGQKTQAIPYLLESMRDISEAEDDLEKKNIALVHVYLGRCFKSAKDTTKAMEYYSFAKPILEAVAPNSKELAKLLYYMVPLLPDPGQKIQFCDSAIEMLHGENKKLAEIYGRKGNVYIKLKQYGEASQCYECAHSLVMQFPDNHQDRVRLCQAFAVLLIEVGDADRALEILAEGNASLPLTKDLKDQATALFLTGEAQLLQGKKDSARVSFEGAKSTYMECGEEWLVAKCERRLKKLAELGG